MFNDILSEQKRHEDAPVNGNENLYLKLELDVMESELDFILKTEMNMVFNDLANQIQIILKYLTKTNEKEPIGQYNIQQRNEKLSLIAPHGLEGIKCSLNMNAQELTNIEINYKPTQRHNNYIYKSKEDCCWNVHQVVNCGDLLKSVLAYLSNLSLPFVSLDQAMFHIDSLLENINLTRNVLLFPKKRLISELQNQKNMRIFPLVPNELVFSFYIQGFKLVLAIYFIKGTETSKYTLECNSITWLNNVMILLTSCLQKLQQLKDKLKVFEQLKLNDEPLVNQTKETQNQPENEDFDDKESCVFHL